MSVTLIVQAIMAALQFPNEVLSLVKALQATPAEQQSALISSIQGEIANFQKTGRPTWS